MKTRLATSTNLASVKVTARRFDLALKILTTLTSYLKEHGEHVEERFISDVFTKRIDGFNTMPKAERIKLSYLGAALIKISRDSERLEQLEMEAVKEGKSWKEKVNATRKLGKVYRRLETTLGRFHRYYFSAAVGETIYTVSQMLSAKSLDFETINNAMKELEIQVTLVPAKLKNRNPSTTLPFSLLIEASIEELGFTYQKTYSFITYEICK